jgi:two-component system response regulator HydG
MCRGTEIEPKDLSRELMSTQRTGDEAPKIPGTSMAELEKYAILKTLEHVGGSTRKAAEILGISTRKIQYKLHEYEEGATKGEDADGGADAPEDAAAKS